MERRLELLPSDLERFFQHMLDGIEEVYKPQTAQIFEMVTIAKTPLSVFLLQYLEQESLDPHYAVKAQRTYLSEADMIRVKKRLTKYLNARCKGLLEIYYDEHRTFSFCYKIEFLHRTVKITRTSWLQSGDQPLPGVLGPTKATAALRNQALCFDPGRFRRCHSGYLVLCSTGGNRA